MRTCIRLCTSDRHAIGRVAARPEGRGLGGGSEQKDRKEEEEGVSAEEGRVSE